MQLYLALTMLRLKIFYNLFVRGNCLSNERKKIFATFVSTLLLKGVLNHIMFLCLLFFGLAVVLMVYFRFNL